VFEPGEIFDIPDLKDVKYLIKTHGCEVASSQTEVLDEFSDGPREEAALFGSIEKASAIDEISESSEIEVIKHKGGWYEWEGKKYRKAKLPAKAAALLE
jgi:hypothetical protein